MNADISQWVHIPCKRKRLVHIACGSPHTQEILLLNVPVHLLIPAIPTAYLFMSHFIKSQMWCTLWLVFYNYYIECHPIKLVEIIVLDLL